MTSIAYFFIEEKIVRTVNLERQSGERQRNLKCRRKRSDCLVISFQGFLVLASFVWPPRIQIGLNTFSLKKRASRRKQDSLFVARKQWESVVTKSVLRTAAKFFYAKPHCIGRAFDL